ncbi:MAG: hypothetical protein QG645_444, partial [Patescibacteria group bacterium]|nr:hypothetical protein [Patescibacteria group bacterium]
MSMAGQNGALLLLYMAETASL